MMTRAKLYLLLVLLKAYRAHLCWADDEYGKRASAMIHDVRLALANNGFYRHDLFRIEKEAA